jgi:hypothetical protein
MQYNLLYNFERIVKMQPTIQQKTAKFFLALIFLFLTACGDSADITDATALGNNSLSDNSSSDNSSSDNSSSDNSSSNSAPIATAQSITIDGDTAKNILLSATDSDGNILTYTITAQPKKGKLTGRPPYLIYTPNVNEMGADSFTFRVNDGINNSEKDATVSITITPVNTAPIAIAQTIITNEGTTKSITLHATDSDNDILTYTITTQPVKGTLTGDAPNLTYTPKDGENGADSFTFKVNDGTLDSVSDATVSITITLSDTSNAAPIATAQPIITDEDTAKSITLSATDSNGDSLTYTITSQPKKGTLTGDAPNLTYTPTTNLNGADSFTFKVNDGTLDSVSDTTVSIMIIPVADLSVSDVSVTEGDTGTTTLVFTLTLDAYEGIASVGYATSDNTATANDDYVAQTEGVVIFQGDSVSETISIVINGDIIEEPDETFTLTLRNARNLQLSTAIATGVIINDDFTPIATPQSITTDEDTARSITLSATGSNNDSLTHTITITTPPAKGTLTGNAPNLIYTPNANENGEDSFTFKVDDGVNDLVSDVKISITITPVADLSISVAPVKEGAIGTTYVEFTLELDAYEDIASVDYATSDNTATEGDDYARKTGTVTFRDSTTSKTIRININGDTIEELDETFTLTLSNLKNLQLKTTTATGTIINDDFHLNDTGITWAGGGGRYFGNSRNCGSDINGKQDCDYGRDKTHNDSTDGVAGFSFTKLDAEGVALADQTKRDHVCIKDNVTDLIWEKSRPGSRVWSKVGGLVDAANDAKKCGFDDWRVPDIEELRSIAHLGRAQPPIDRNYFPHTQHWWYWSSTRSGSRTHWTIYFKNGNNENRYDYSVNCLRLVRGNRPFVSTVADADIVANQKKHIDHQWQDSRYIDNGDETVTDKKTGLMWKQCPEGSSGSGCTTGNMGKYTYKGAIEHADKKITFANHSDWRLPNIKELASLLAHDRRDPAINRNLFPNTPGSDFWSSSPDASSDTNYSYSWKLNFGYGNNDHRYRYNKYYVRLVRGK